MKETELPLPTTIPSDLHNAALRALTMMYRDALKLNENRHYETLEEKYDVDNAIIEEYGTVLDYIKYLEMRLNKLHVALE